MSDYTGFFNLICRISQGFTVYYQKNNTTKRKFIRPLMLAHHECILCIPKCNVCVVTVLQTARNFAYIPF